MSDVHAAVRAVARRSKAPGSAVAVHQVGAATGQEPQRVSNMLRTALAFGLVERAAPPPALFDTGYRGFVYRATPLGRQVAAMEGWAQGRLPTRRAATEVQERAWRAMRVQRKFSGFSLAAATLDVGSTRSAEQSAMRSLQRYLRALKRCGVVSELGRDADGYARYVLVEDLGPLAPVPQPAGGRVWDRNAARYVGKAGA